MIFTVTVLASLWGWARGTLGGGGGGSRVDESVPA